MQENVNINEIDDIHELNKFYVACNEALLMHDTGSQRERNNIEIIRQRISVLNSQEEKDVQ